MSDGDEMKRLLDKIHAQQSILNLREMAKGIVRDMKSMGLNREEAVAYLSVPFHDLPQMLPMAQLLVRRYWKKVR